MFAAKCMARLSRRGIARALIATAVAGLAGCGGGQNYPNIGGGGGAGAPASPYGLFASSYIVYTTPPASGAFLHSVQSGDLFAGFVGNYGYGQYSAAQAAINAANGVYTIQAKATATAPTTSGDVAYVAFLAPGNNSGATPTFDISQSATLLIQMGNTYNPAFNGGAVGGNAKVFTIDLNNAKGATASTNDCSINQTVVATVKTYAIPLNSAAGWTCSKGGTLAALQAEGITTVAVKIEGNNNTAAVANEFDIISVGYIGFSATAPSDFSALAQ